MDAADVPSSQRCPQAQRYGAPYPHPLWSALDNASAQSDQPVPSLSAGCSGLYVDLQVCDSYGTREYPIIAQKRICETGREFG